MPRSKKVKLNAKTKSAIRKAKSLRKSKTEMKAKSVVNTDSVIARCMKCRKQMTMENPKMVTLKNGRSAMKGLCICGTKMFKFV